MQKIEVPDPNLLFPFLNLLPRDMSALFRPKLLLRLALPRALRKLSYEARDQIMKGNNSRKHSFLRRNGGGSMLGGAADNFYQRSVVLDSNFHNSSR